MQFEIQNSQNESFSDLPSSLKDKIKLEEEFEFFSPIKIDQNISKPLICKSANFLSKNRINKFEKYKENLEFIKEEDSNLEISESSYRDLKKNNLLKKSQDFFQNSENNFFNNYENNFKKKSEKNNSKGGNFWENSENFLEKAKNKFLYNSEFNINNIPKNIFVKKSEKEFDKLYNFNSLNNSGNDLLNNSENIFLENSEKNLRKNLNKNLSKNSKKIFSIKIKKDSLENFEIFEKSLSKNSFDNYNLRKSNNKFIEKNRNLLIKESENFLENSEKNMKTIDKENILKTSKMTFFKKRKKNIIDLKNDKNYISTFSYDDSKILKNNNSKDQVKSKKKFVLKKSFFDLNLEDINKKRSSEFFSTTGKIEKNNKIRSTSKNKKFIKKFSLKKILKKSYKKNINVISKREGIKEINKRKKKEYSKDKNVYDISKGRKKSKCFSKEKKLKEFFYTKKNIHHFKEKNLNKILRKKNLGFSKEKKIKNFNLEMSVNKFMKSSQFFDIYKTIEFQKTKFRTQNSFFNSKKNWLKKKFYDDNKKHSNLSKIESLEIISKKNKFSQHLNLQNILDTPKKRRKKTIYEKFFRDSKSLDYYKSLKFEKKSFYKMHKNIKTIIYEKKPNSNSKKNSNKKKKNFKKTTKRFYDKKNNLIKKSLEKNKAKKIQNYKKIPISNFNPKKSFTVKNISNKKNSLISLKNQNFYQNIPLYNNNKSYLNGFYTNLYTKFYQRT